MGVFESFSDWTWEVDVAGVYTHVSPGVEDILGYKPEEVVGRTPFDFMPPDEATRVASMFRDIVEVGGPIITLENIGLHKDGRRVILETSAFPVLNEDRKIIGYQGIDRDITDRKRAEDELRESNAKHERLVNNLIETFLYRHDVEGVWTYVSSSVTQVLGYSVDESLTNFSRRLTDHPVNRLAAKYREQSIKGIPQSPYEIQVYHKEGSVRWLEVSETPVRDTEGNVVAVEGVRRQPKCALTTTPQNCHFS
jgi:PAS domain S-box-containing protein